MASLTDVISKEVVGVLLDRLSIEIDAQDYLSLNGNHPVIRITARLKIDEATISTSTTELELND